MYTSTNTGLVVYASSAGDGKFHSDALDAYKGKSQGFIETGSNTPITTIGGLMKLDDAHKYDKAWKISSAVVSVTSDVLTVAKVAKIVAKTPTLAKIFLGGVQEFFIPGADDVYGTFVSLGPLKKKPELSWLADLLPIYGSTQAVLDASSDEPAFVEIK